MTKAALTRHPGVLRRPDSNIYQFGLRVPRDLLAHFPSPWAVRCSLGTADLREANDKAKALQAEWVVRFEALRSGKPAPVDLPALRGVLLGHVERALEATDARVAEWTPAARKESADRMAWMRDEAKQAMTQGVVPEWVEESLGQMGYSRSPVADAEAMAYLVMQLDLFHEALTDETRTYPIRVRALASRRALVRADAARGASDTMPAAAGPKAQRDFKIADALEVWERKDRPAKTLGAFRRHADQFASIMGDPALATIGKTEAIEFRNQLQAWAVANGKTARTADNVLVSIKALVNVARDQGWIEGNPFERLTVDVGGKESEGREPWTPDELGVLFDDPIWTAYRLPTDRKAGRAAAYWIPLLACYTGARVSEIAQLWTDDLSLDEGNEVVEFRANAKRKQSLKTEGSWRAVPLHSELIRLGLRDYVASLPAGPLFPALPVAGENGAGGQFSQWFGQFKQGKGFDSPRKTLHSFRHLVATELRLSGASDAQADAITGHAGTGMGRTTYSATIRRQARRMRAVVELLRFPELLRLKRVSEHSSARKAG